MNLINRVQDALLSGYLQRKKEKKSTLSAGCVSFSRNEKWHEYVTWRICNSRYVKRWFVLSESELLCYEDEAATEPKVVACKCFTQDDPVPSGSATAL